MPSDEGRHGDADDGDEPKEAEVGSRDPFRELALEKRRLPNGISVGAPRGEEAGR